MLEISRVKYADDISYRHAARRAAHAAMGLLTPSVLSPSPLMSHCSAQPASSADSDVTFEFARSLAAPVSPSVLRLLRG